MGSIGQMGPVFAKRRAVTIAELPTDYRPAQAGVVMQSVKAQNGAIVYSDSGPIGEDEFVLVPVDSTITEAIKAGDLVKDPAHPKAVLVDPEEQLRVARAGPQKRMHHVKVTEANPVPAAATIAPREPQMHRRQPPPPPRPRTPPAE